MMLDSPDTVGVMYATFQEGMSCTRQVMAILQSSTPNHICYEQGQEARVIDNCSNKMMSS